MPPALRLLINGRAGGDRCRFGGSTKIGKYPATRMGRDRSRVGAFRIRKWIAA